MRREGRRPVAARRKLESTPAWMQVVEPRLEQAAEESRAGMLGDVQAASVCARPDGMGVWIVTPACAGMSC